MGELVFIGLGLGDERGITLGGIEEARKADLAFADCHALSRRVIRTLFCPSPSS